MGSAYKILVGKYYKRTYLADRSVDGKIILKKLVEVSCWAADCIEIS
jgi:hypothetical protein